VSTVAPRLLHVFSTFVPGGPQVRTVQLVNAFGTRFRHAVVAMDGRTTARELVDPGIDVELVPRPAARGTFGTARALRALLEELRPHLLLTYNWGAIEAVLAARSLGFRRVLHHEDGFLPDEARGFKRRRVWFRRWVLRGARRVIVPSRTLERIAREVWRLAPERVRWIPNGIHTDRFPAGDAAAPLRQHARAELAIPPDAEVVGAVGHLRGEKNFARLIDAFERLGEREGGVERRLLILGDGELRAELEARRAASPRADAILLPGHRDDLAPYYAAMDVFALGSDTEQMPIALLEAMCAGLPVVATDVGDVAAVLPPEQAEWVVELAGDATAGRLADALARALADRTARAAHGRRNRARVVGELSFERMLEAYAEELAGALEAPAYR